MKRKERGREREKRERERKETREWGKKRKEGQWEQKMIQSNHQEKFRKLYRYRTYILYSIKLYMCQFYKTNMFSHSPGTSVKIRADPGSPSYPCHLPELQWEVISTSHQDLDPTKPQTNQIIIPTFEQVHHLCSSDRSSYSIIWNPLGKEILKPEIQT